MYCWRGCLLICQTEYLIYFCSCFFSLKWKFRAIFLIYGFLKDNIKIQLKWTQNGFKLPSYDIDIITRLLIPTTGKEIQPQHCRVCCQKTVSCFWLVSQTKSKIPILCMDTGQRLQKYDVIAERWYLIVKPTS